MPTLLVCSATDDLHTLTARLAAEALIHLPDLQVKLWPEPFNAKDVVAVAAWHPPANLLGTLPRLKLIASISAGTEHIQRCADLPPAVPITRIVDDEQARGMAEYTLWAALYYHRGFDQMLAQQARGQWRVPAQTPARDFQVGVLGMGLMGRQTALCLRDFGFTVSGWSRTPHTLDNIAAYSGETGLTNFLQALDMVVCLLPLTAATRGLCDRQFFNRMKPGAAFINAGRGEHVVIADLVSALAQDQLRGAVLDVFETEPLASGDTLWRHPKILITPHMASTASEGTIAQQITDNMIRLLCGQPVQHGIDRCLGY
jgi:glyoxylate/hydroxypyruvate reductase A